MIRKKKTCPLIVLSLKLVPGLARTPLHPSGHGHRLDEIKRWAGSAPSSLGPCQDRDGALCKHRGWTVF